MSQSLTDRYDDRIAGVLSCYDRVVVTGTLPGVCYADGMTRYLNARGIRIFDYPEFAKPLRDHVRDCAATLAAEAGLTIEHRDWCKTGGQAATAVGGDESLAIWNLCPNSEPSIPL
jgi:hypothetical protein